MATSTYGRILREIDRLMRIGAVEKRGRPPLDTEKPDFRFQRQVWGKAVESLPPAERSEWKEYVSRSNVDLRLSRSHVAKQAAATRRGDSTVDGQLTLQTQANKRAKADRILAIKRAVTYLESHGKRVTSKTVARQLERAGEPPLKEDTIRKLLAEIRQGRATT